VLSVRVDPEHALDAAGVLADLTDEPIVDSVTGEIRLSVTDSSASAEAARTSYRTGWRRSQTSIRSRSWSTSCGRR
jgi:hypothetical protein